MENKAQFSETKIGKKNIKNAAKTASIRIKASSKKLAKSLRDEANQKKLGRKIMMDEIFDLALSLVTKEHLKVLQEGSLTFENRKELLRQKFIETRGPITQDDFTGFMMRPEFSDFLREHDQVIKVA